ncbi:MAG: linear amide C-N hydrolase [Legionellaceae bacterium]|nr:linear amide C-N hydrolase [Legionellaceae bacterium]
MDKRFYRWSTTLLILLTSPHVMSCTNVFANDKGDAKVVARSMDLYVSDMPMILTQPQGQTRSGEAGEHSLTWTSKYGSLVVTAFHTSTVSDGINEKRLSAHMLYLTGSEYPKSEPNTPQISNALWAQYVLDNFASVDEVIKGMKTLHLVATKVHGRTWPIHLAVEDASGDSAIIEFIKGEAKIYHGKQYRVMTNEPAYSIQLANLKNYKSFGGSRSLPGDTDPLSRFVRVATYLKTLPPAKTEVDSIAGILSVIRSAMVPFGAEDTSDSKTEDAWPTRWITVADVTHGFYFFNSTSAPNIVWFDLSKINFSKNAPALSIDPTNIHLEGDITNKLSTHS